MKIKLRILNFVLFVFLYTGFLYAGVFRINNGTVTLNNGADLNISVDLEIGSSGVLKEGTGTGVEIQVQGKWINSGDFDAGSSTVTFYGLVSSTITGNTSFYTLKCETGGKKIYFEAGSTQVVTGSLILNGSSGNEIVLRSTSTPTRWFIKVLTPQTVSYVDVQDSDVLGNDITASNSINSGNNDDDEESPRWIFYETIPPAAITTLSASTYSTAGAVQLQWEAPGDDGWSGMLLPGSQFKIQYATYNISWDRTNAQITISTSGINPHTVVSKIITLSKETTYYFRIWTSDEIPNWSDISSGATVWCRIAPSAITTLTALAEADGDVKLSWIAPGDDGTAGNITGGQWKIRFSTISTVDWTSGVWNDWDDKYEILIDTDATPLSEHTKTITGLHGGVTYYFRIWTRDEATGANSPGNWSEISNGATATVVKVIGISASTDTYDFGEVPVGGSSVSVSGIIIKNTGNVFEDYSLRISSITLYDNSPSVWESTDTTVGHNRFILYSIFHGTTPASSYFVNKDTVTTVNQTSDSERYTYDGGATGWEQTGANVPKQEERIMWLKIDMPTTVTTSKKEKIKVTVTAGESP